ncbi:MAG: glycosyltransferase family 39 protein [Patescibacteria group bacterium]
MGTNKNLLLIVLLAFALRIIPLGFPPFTQEEARVAFRGYSLAISGKDELGRLLPLLFNSLEDYRLPLVSYLTGLGVFLFGKSDLGVRLPFILMGTALVLLIYYIAKSLSAKPFFWLASGLVVALSPPLIFLSKTPNESIVLTFIFALLFYLLINNKRLFTIPVMILAIFLSKFTWFLLVPFIFFTGQKGKLLTASLVFVLLALAFFLQVPQSKRSLSENNFSLFSDVTIINGINKLRGQGIESNWSPLLGEILINKSYFFVTGFFHFLSNLAPSILFGQFDKNGNLGFVGMGAFPKIAILPALLGMLFLIREKRSKFLLYSLIITLPSALIYPQFSPQIVILAIPFIAFVIAFGFLQMKKSLSTLIFILMALELIVNLSFLSPLSPQIKSTTYIRPGWIKTVVEDVFKLSNTNRVLISDDIVEDITPFIGWYTPFNPSEAFLDIPYPYKFRQTKLGKITVVGVSDSFKTCGTEENTQLFSSKRDLQRLKSADIVDIEKTYLDSKGEDATYLIKGRVCIK